MVNLNNILGLSIALTLIIIALVFTRKEKYSIVPAIVFLSLIFASLFAPPLSLSPTYLAFLGFIYLMAILNLTSINSLKVRVLPGIDYLLTLIIVIATFISLLPNIDLITAILALILTSVPTYVLILLGESTPRSVNVGIKYITFMVFATVMYIIGVMVYVYAYSIGSTLLSIAGFIVLLVGLCLEVGIGPFHEWVPDVFTAGDPIPVSIIASIAKFVPFIITFRILLTYTIPEVLPILALIIAIISGISMFIGNIGALTAREPGRILAYSTIANMGYVLAAFTAIISPKPEVLTLACTAILLQLLVNAFGKIGFFTSIKGGGSSSILTYILALSFIGMPPLMGFWSKLFIILTLASIWNTWNGALGLAIVLVFNSALSIPYYIRLAKMLGRPWSRTLIDGIVLITALIMLLTVVPPFWFIQAINTFTFKLV